MTRDISFTCKLLFTCLVYSAATECVEMLMSTRSAVLGHTAYIYCSADFLPTEINREVEISNKNLGLQTLWTQAENMTLTRTDADVSRYTIEVDTAVDNLLLLTLNIQELACRDEGVYTCLAKVDIVNSTLQVYSRQQVQLDVLVDLSPPELQMTNSLESPMVSSPEPQVVKEHDWVDVECRAVIGHNNQTRLNWKLYLGNHVEAILDRDARIIAQEVTKMAGEEGCLRQITSRLRIVVTRTHQGVQAACFVWVPGSEQTPPLNCDHREKDLCAKTPRLVVHYGVKEDNMQLYISPRTQVKDGATISLLCHADGYPPANYSWTRVPPLDLSTDVVIRTQEDSDSTGSISSKLVIADFHHINHTGVYRCTAWNWVVGVEYFTASQDIFVSNVSPAQKHGGLLETASPFSKFDSVKLLLLGVAACAIVIFVITLCVVLVTCACRCRARTKPQPQPGTQKQKPGLAGSPDDPGSTTGTETDSPSRD